VLKPSKCNFLYEEIKILGFIVNASGISTDPKQIEGVKNLPKPKTTKELQQQLGLFSYFRKLINNFAQIASPLQSVIGKDKKFEWTDKQESAFNTLKNELIKSPVLALFHPDRETILKTDASTCGLGAALFQIVNGIEKPVAYISRSLNLAEKNYTTTQLELLAISWSLTRLRNLIYGIPIKIYTDHHALCWLLRSTKNELSPKLCRMALTLAEYNIIGIFHISGIKHRVPDCLSRYPTTEFSEKETLRELPILSIQTTNVVTMQENDPEIEVIKNKLLNNEPRSTKKYSLIHGILYYRNVKANRDTLFIPQHMRTVIMTEFHEDPISGGHLGFFKTFQKIKQRYCWPKMKQQIGQHVQACHNCQTRIIQRHKPYGTMQFFEIPKEAFHRIQIDVMGPFTNSTKGNKYVVTAIDYLTKWIEAKAIKEATTENIAKFTVEQIICRHGCPKVINTDRGTTFTSELFQELNKFMGITHKVSTAYHPQTQGLVEKSHNTLTDCLSMYTSATLKNWDSLLPHIVFAINCSIHETTRYSPFYLLYDREAVVPLESNILLSKHATLEEIIANMKDARIIAGNRIHSKQHQYRQLVNSKRLQKEFSIGDLVLVRKFIKKKRLSTKLMHYFYCPYTIKEKINDVNYLIEYTNKKRVFRETVHVEKIKHYYERNENGISGDIITNKANEEDQYAHKKDDSIPTTSDLIEELECTGLYIGEDENENVAHYNLRKRKPINFKN